MNKQSETKASNTVRPYGGHAAPYEERAWSKYQAYLEGRALSGDGEYYSRFVTWAAHK